jgi:hypothetical protein
LCQQKVLISVECPAMALAAMADVGRLLDAELKAAGTSPEHRVRAAAAAIDRVCHHSPGAAPILERFKRE